MKSKPIDFLYMGIIYTFLFKFNSFLIKSLSIGFILVSIPSIIYIPEIIICIFKEICNEKEFSIEFIKENEKLKIYILIYIIVLCMYKFYFSIKI